jgi:hypothetical protein
MSKIRALAVFALAAVGPLATCESGKGPEPLTVTDMSPLFSLSHEDRQSLNSDVDPDALERFLSALPPEARASVLRSFQRNSFTYIVSVSDPSLQELLEAVRRPASRSED